MTKYECGHESEMLVLDDSPSMFSAYLQWSEDIETYGDKLMCFNCWYNSFISKEEAEAEQTQLEAEGLEVERAEHEALEAESGEREREAEG